MTKDKMIDVEFDGFKFSYDPDCIDDMEFLELTAAVEHDGDFSKYPALVKLFLGEKAYKEATDYFKSKYGKFTASKCADLFSKALEAAGPKE